MLKRLYFLKTTFVILAISSTAVLFACTPKKSNIEKQVVSKNLQDLKTIIDKYSQKDIGFLSSELALINKTIVEGQTSEASKPFDISERNSD